MAEMVCRTMKEILRAEIATIALIPDGTTSIAALFAVELLNRAIYNLLVRDEFWLSHFMDVLRTKYHTPDSFTIPQVTVTKRTILAFLTIRLGTIFESGKFVRIAPLYIASTYPKQDAIVRMVLQGKRTEAHQILLSQYKKVNDIRMISLQVCSMVHQCVQFAIARSSSLDWYAQMLNAKLQEVDNPVVRSCVEGVLLECLYELPEATKYSIAFTKFLEGRLRSNISKDSTVSQEEITYGVEKRRSNALLVATIEKSKEKTTVGSVQFRGCGDVAGLGNSAPHLSWKTSTSYCCATR